MTLSIPRSFVLASLAASASIPAAAQETYDRWNEAERFVAERLNGGRDLGEWAQEVAEATPRGAMGLVALDVALRAGQRAAAEDALDGFGALAPALAAEELRQVADFLIGREEWALAQRFLERFPETIPGWSYLLVRHWRETRESDWIDAWLDERARSGSTYWLDERLRFRKELGTERELLDEMAAAVRARPADVRLALRYARAAEVLGLAEGERAWLVDVARPALASESLELAEALRSPAATRTLLELSLATPFQPADHEYVERLSSHMCAPVGDPEEFLRETARWRLMEAYQALGESAKAQALLESFADRYPPGTVPPGIGALAGPIQGGSGARTIEGRILAAEPAHEDDVEYWLERANYYVGRGEREEARRALEAALERAQSQPDRVGVRGWSRRRAAGAYVRFLSDSCEGRAREELLRRELERADPESELAKCLVYALLDLGDSVRSFPVPEDEVVWRFLEARPWSELEESLLSRLFERIPAKEREHWWLRAERLAGRDPTKGWRLGCVMRNVGDAQRALLPLRLAVERLESPEERERATFTLFEGYLEVFDWRSAEALWPEASRQLGPDEQAKWLRDLATAALRVGKREDALRLWRRHANLDRCALEDLEDFAKAGLGPGLRSFYEELASKEPGSWVPDAALARLAKLDAGG